MLKLKEIRISKGIKQEELANFLNVTQQAISRYESGNRKLSPQQIIDISLFLETTPNELLGFDEAYKKYTDYLMTLKNDDDNN